MTGCDQATITDAAFAHLKGIHTLNIRDCNGSLITHAANDYLFGTTNLFYDTCSEDEDSEDEDSEAEWM